MMSLMFSTCSGRTVMANEKIEEKIVQIRENIKIGFGQKSKRKKNLIGMIKTSNERHLRYDRVAADNRTPG